MVERLTPEAFNAEMADLQPGDNAFHAMLHPGIYPSKFDERLHADLLAEKSVALDTPFFGILRELAARKVTLQWLRVLPQAGQFGYNEQDITAMHKAAQLIGETGNVEVRVTDYTTSMVRLAGSVAIASPLTAEYMNAAETDSPSGSFWLLDRAGDQPQRIVDVMRYNRGVFTGHSLRPLTDEPDTTGHYVEFWQEEYESYGKPA
jgi:hypothetical protein